MEKILIPESKCQRLGKDSDVLKINIWHGKKNEGVGKDEVGVVGQGEAEMRCQDRQKETERERQRHRGSGRLCETAGSLFLGEEIQASSEHSLGAENLPTLRYGPAEQSGMGDACKAPGNLDAANISKSSMPCNQSPGLSWAAPRNPSSALLLLIVPPK